MTVATVGDSATARMTVSTDEIEDYAALVGDDNPLHVDDGYAAETMFEGRIAHGMLPAGLVSAALADLPGDVVYVSQDLEFRAPVRPGDTVAATVEVVEDLGEGQLRVQTTADVDGTTVLCGEAVVLSLAHEPAEGSCEAEAGAD
ncbi:MaoC family dehydratase [Haloarchaeobius iranensis]|uniref:3-hydroxybutyryl-CoA dehydratase n=1 Tax=Haloarchaeobius iranensis TaxID=996166 RepID=A0A1G9SDG0_9EURY|nr:MaoC family dehydratase [Haloarchaeobius iranensis]SDM33432.1 3-hydroxybutyryl-CoA dehydratase [Haloarchaeobius iranensis]